MEHASTVDIGTRKRRTGGVNEDSVATAVLENHHRMRSRPVGIFVLGDGVGGEASGDVASFLATTVVRKRLTEAVLGSGTDVIERFGVDSYDGSPPTVAETPGSTLSAGYIRSAIQDGIDAAHRHVQEFAREAGGRPATTLVVGVYADGRLHYGWVGDSRIYLVNTRLEEIQQLTRDHAVTNELLERGDIDDEAYARVHAETTAITNAVGGSPHGKSTVDVDFGSAAVYSDDVILLTSDGLIDAFPDIRPLREKYERADDTDAVCEEIRDTLVTDEEIRDIVLEAPDLREGVERLVAFANERGGKDNLSITLARDPNADPSPDALPSRGTTHGAGELIDQETVIETPQGNGDSGSGVDANGSSGDVESGTPPNPESSEGADSEASAGIVSATDPELPTAAITIAGTETIYEIVDGVTIGRDDDDEDAGPNIGLVVDDEVVERNHVRLERDEAGDWLLRDTSAAGTFVEDDGEWIRLGSDEVAGTEGAQDGDESEEREDDIDGSYGRRDGDESYGLRDGDESYGLRDGTAFALEDPRSTDPITFRFFTSVERAQNRASDGQATGYGFLDRFRS